RRRPAGRGVECVQPVVVLRQQTCPETDFAPPRALATPVVVLKLVTLEFVVLLLVVVSRILPARAAQQRAAHRGASEEAPVSHGASHRRDRKSTRLNSSHVKSSYADFRLKEQ